MSTDAPPNTPEVCTRHTSAAAPSAGSPERRLLRRLVTGTGPLQATLVITILLLVFLWQPLLKGGTYAGTDILQHFPILRVAPSGYFIKNSVIGDTVILIHPGLKWDVENVRAGRLPLWNPYNGYGVPHLANYESAVFSPFTVPFYLLSFKTALVVSAFMKLFGLGLFTYLFLRLLRLDHGPSLIGAVAYTFGGYHIVWLAWPCAGNVALPAGLYFAELAFQSAASWPKRYLALLGFTAALTVGLLAGHPETFFYCALLLMAYLAFRVLDRTLTWPQRAVLTAEFTATGILSIAISAAQLLPFFEYVSQSATLAAREPHGLVAKLLPQYLATAFFPNLVGNPTTGYQEAVAKVNFNELNGHYCGLLVLFLAVLAMVLLPRFRSRFVVFFSAVSILWLAWIYDVFGVMSFTAKLPLMKLGIALRSHDIWLMAVAILAALAAQAVLAHHRELAGTTDRRATCSGAFHTLAVAFTAAALLVVVLVGTYVTLQWVASQPGATLGTPKAQRVVLITMAAVLVPFLAGVFAMALATVKAERRWVAPTLTTVLVVGIFLQTGGLLIRQNPTIEDSLFYPTTPMLGDIVATSKNEQMLFVQRANLPANSNLWYHIRAAGNYDGMGVKVFEDVFRAKVGAPGIPFNPTELRTLQALGIRYVASGEPSPFATPASVSVPVQPAHYSPRALYPAERLRQHLVVTAPNLNAIRLLMVTYKRENSCSVKLRLLDSTGTTELASATRPCQDATDWGPLTLAFPPIPDSKGKTYTIEISSPDATASSPVGVLFTSKTLPGCEATTSSGPLGGTLCAEAFAENPAFPGLERVWGAKDLALFKVPGSLPRQLSVGTCQSYPDFGTGMATLFSPAFPLHEKVLLKECPKDVGPGEGAPVEVVEETATRLRFRTQRSTPGWVVVLQTFFPGWHATVNGTPAAVQQANLAFTAVPVGAGSSDVVLEYRPASVRQGLAISGVSLAVTVCLLVVAVRARRRRSTADSDGGPRPVAISEP